VKNNWQTKKLKEVVTYSKGKKPRNLGSLSSERRIPYIDIQAFEKGVFRKYSDNENINIANKKDVLIVWDGARFGLSGHNVSGAVGSTIMKVTPNLNMNSKFLSYFIKSKYKDIQNKPRGVGIPHVESSLLWNYDIPVPDKDIQATIAQTLDSLLSKIDAGEEGLKKVEKQLEVYRQVVLKRAFDSYDKKIKISDIAEVGTGATPKRGNIKYWMEGSVPWVTSSVVNKDIVNEASEYITQSALKETNTKLFPKGTLLMAMYGEGKTRGKVTELGFEAATNQALAAIQLKNEYVKYKDFIKLFFLKNYEEIRTKSAGGVQPNLNLSIIKNMEIPIPEYKNAEETVFGLKSTLSKITKLKELLKMNKILGEGLRQSILKKAFNGELT
jgi:type I restriction enzyme S subunit